MVQWLRPAILLQGQGWIPGGGTKIPCGQKVRGKKLGQMAIQEGEAPEKKRKEMGQVEEGVAE